MGKFAAGYSVSKIAKELYIEYSPISLPTNPVESWSAFLPPSRVVSSYDPWKANKVQTKNLTLLLTSFYSHIFII